MAVMVCVFMPNHHGTEVMVQFLQTHTDNTMSLNAHKAETHFMSGSFIL